MILLLAHLAPALAVAPAFALALTPANALAFALALIPAFALCFCSCSCLDPALTPVFNKWGKELSPVLSVLAKATLN